MTAVQSPAVRQLSRLPGRLTVAGMVVAVVIAVDLHLRLSKQVSPVWQTLSEYVYGHVGSYSAAPLFSAMCLALSLGSLALLVGIATRRRSWPIMVLLGLWCTGLLICATFPVDPEGQARSFSGQLHNYAALVAFVALPSAAWLLTRSGVVRCPWEPRRKAIRRLAVASLLSVVIVLGGFVATLIIGASAHPEVTMGLFERLLFTIDLLLLATMVRPLLSSAESR